ncbi:hypothetical protein [Paraburkholderia silvatlantica]|uniref:Uncharacterized protein n=1 Tax=Paraburkholderia silvatlantica TaxID=321895 RepID=A0ABR6FLQ9_9BURK|nr:hypothetical protein [Paraburkholderia silvatlantica]MBB2928360.1 hypothetical protein [Paraburkholderia silvatlantica]PVY34594.1 hypothetical protein C7411_107130 [Paraburkholderia silvatlantica]PXW38809.1 hypothetical protein C7413_107130 [Paraburkholderia silvatlantica]
MSQPWLITPNTRIAAAKAASQKSATFKFTAESRTLDEVAHFAPRMTDAQLEQYARRTTKRPLLCFAFLAASPFLMELACRLLGAW